jgi:hypothetical protein
MSEFLTMPTRENVLKACAFFVNDKNNPDPSLIELFNRYPKNTDFAHVLLKVVTLNALYSTLIRVNSQYSPTDRKYAPTVYDVARHIVELKIDAALSGADEAQSPGLRMSKWPAGIITITLLRRSIAASTGPNPTQFSILARKNIFGSSEIRAGFVDFSSRRCGTTRSLRELSTKCGISTASRISPTNRSTHFFTLKGGSCSQPNRRPKRRTNAQPNPPRPAP